MRSRFSNLTIIMATTVVASLIYAATSASRLRQQQRELTAVQQRVAQVKTSASLKQARLKDEFLGVHPGPLIVIDPRVAKATPWIFRINNTKHKGSGGRYWVGSGGHKDRIVVFNVRLLRSLDDVDYYRLTCVIDDQPQPDMLFEYTGNPKVLSASKSATICICPDRDTCVDQAVSRYDADESAALRDAWTNGRYRPIIREI